MGAMPVVCGRLGRSSVSIRVTRGGRPHFHQTVLFGETTARFCHLSLKRGADIRLGRTTAGLESPWRTRIGSGGQMVCRRRSSRQANGFLPPAESSTNL